jgi:YidC/Oxa1 family membrane protein insertase
MAQMELFRKHGVNPLGTCWLLLLQLPNFMGLYYCLQESVMFRLGEFLYIRNLAAPDMLVFWGEGFPWLTRPEDHGGLLYLGPYLNILPIIAVAFMIVQQKMLMPPPTDEQQAMQQKIMKYMMIFFGLLFYKVAAGLCLYFIASTLWGFAERRFLPKKKPTTEGETAESMFQKMRGDTAAAPAPAPAPPAPANGERVTAASNRAKRREERKRRDRAVAQQQAIRTEAPPPPRPEEPVGWFANMRRRISAWWKDVLEKASKK